MSERSPSDSELNYPGSLESMRSEPHEYQPAYRIEEYFTSPRGHRNMEDLIYEIDNAIHHKTDGVAGKIKDILKDPDNDLGRFANMLISQDGVEGLNSPRYTEAFQQNPAMTICRRLIDRAQYDGADDMELLYKRTLTILANITRYELFDRSYDPQDEEWHHRAEHMRYIREGEHTQYLPRRLDNPAYSKEH